MSDNNENRAVASEKIADVHFSVEARLAIQLGGSSLFLVE